MSLRCILIYFLGVINGILGFFGEGKSPTEIMGEMIQAQTEQIFDKIDAQTEILIKYFEALDRRLQNTEDNIIREQKLESYKQMVDDMRGIQTALKIK